MSMGYVSVLGAMVLGLLLAGTLDAAPYQELEHREGYVPVYIREGDTPLHEINPKLAEAFNEIDTENMLERSGEEPETEKKPDMIMMSLGKGDAMLKAQPADQSMSKEKPVEVAAKEPTKASVGQDESDIVEMPIDEDDFDDDESDDDEESDDDSGDKPAKDEPSEAKTNEKQLDEAKEAIDEIAKTFGIEMMEKMSSAATEKPVVAATADNAKDDKKSTNADEASTEVNVANNDDSKKDMPAEASVNASMTKEINVRSVEAPKVVEPEKQSPKTASTDK